MHRERKARLTIVSLGLTSIVLVALGFVFRLDRQRRDHSIDHPLVAYGQSRWKDAETAARAILKEHPSDPGASLVLARALARLGRTERAKAIYARLDEHDLQAEDYFLIGRDLLRNREFGRGVAALEAARRKQPDHAETLDALSHHWTETKKLTDAANAAERLATIPGWEVRGRVRLARLQSELADPERAADLLTSALSQDHALTGADLRPAAAIKLLTQCWLRAGQPAKAIAVLGSLGDPTPDPEVAWLLSRAHLQSGHIPSAATALTAAGDHAAPDPIRIEPAPFVGAASCAPCHKAEYQSQQQSRHANTLVPTSKLARVRWPATAMADSDVPAVSHSFQTTATGIEAVTTVGEASFKAIIAFALGSGHQGQSFVAREPSGQVRELRISHYPRAPEWSRTMDHPAVLPDADLYLGRPITEEAFRKCLDCHSTNVRSLFERKAHPEAQDHGIGCERCHGPAGNHLAAAKAHFIDPAIVRPRLASAEQVVNLCGSCHKASPTVAPESPAFVRFQASTLVLSRCYTESAGGLSCVTCHNPHKNAETAAPHYEAKCVACHQPVNGEQKPSERPGGTTPRSCPVNATRNCLECHMPKVKEAIPRTVFTDHMIRVHRESTQH